MPTDPKRPGLREKAEIRKLEAETAEIEARTVHIRLRTVLVAVAVAFLIVHFTIGGPVISEHGDLIEHLLP